MKDTFRTLLFFYCFFSIQSIVFANTYRVGSNKIYKTPNELYLANVLEDGDIIEIDAESYIGTDALAVWTKNDLIVRGMGGKAHLIANGAYIWGKAIWVCAGDNITVENLEFSGAKVPDKNGAGIRLDGKGLTVKKCYFHDNENGILTTDAPNSNILVEFTEFANNGYGDGLTHNIYVNKINRLTFRYNYSHHTNTGHNLKSRAKENIIVYNRIMDETTGNSSRLIDISNGGFTIIMGNLLMQGNSALNRNMVGYGLEGLIYPQNEFYSINNTMVNKRLASCTFIDVISGTSIVDIRNSIFTGDGEILRGVGASSTKMLNNLIEPTISNVRFVDEINYNYQLLQDSPAINAGDNNISPVNGFNLIPENQYVHPVNFETRFTVDNVIDIGSYEYSESLSISENELETIKIFPNPFTDNVFIEGKNMDIKTIKLYTILGQELNVNIKKTFDSNKYEFSANNLNKGTYLIKTGDYSVRKLIKK